MKKAFFLLALLGTAGASGTARADVSWEHRGTVSIGKSPVIFMLLKNQWSGQRYRSTATVDTSKMAAMMGMGGMPSAKAARSTSTAIQRLDDDRYIMTWDNDKSYIDEPLKTFKSRLRINFWEALGSNLTANDVPELTQVQRERLGQEIRAIYTPFLKPVMRNYFRALPEKRTVSGLNCRGYRFTSMINVSSQKSRPEWVRAVAEWWLADDQAGDDEIRTFTQSLRDTMGPGGPTASMWINEQLPVLWEAAPVEMHQAVASIMGEMGSPKYGFQGTPVQFFMTVTPPPAEAAMGGDFRVSMVLTKRDTDAVPSSAFDVPAGASRIEVEPFLGMARNFIKMGKNELEKMIP